MIDPESFSAEWIMSHRQDKRFKRINPPVLEKMIRALSLLEALVMQNLKFTFKGGTSLILLLPEPTRFSVDIDVISGHSREQLEIAFDAIINTGLFTRWELDEHRSYKDGIPKAHYFFYYESSLNKQAVYVLLDILFDEHCYAAIEKLKIQSAWLKNSGPFVSVDVPTVESICGDKLTAFAPNTTGVPYARNKSLEIVKQLYDVGNLFDHIQNISHVEQSFSRIVEKEIKYRSVPATWDGVLDDTIATALMMGKPPKHHTWEEKPGYEEIIKGIQQLKGYLMTGDFYIERAMESAAKAAYLAAKLRSKDLSPLQYYDGESIGFQFEDLAYNPLNRLKKIRNGSLFYWSKAAELLGIT